VPRTLELLRVTRFLSLHFALLGLVGSLTACGSIGRLRVELGLAGGMDPPWSRASRDQDYQRGQNR